MEQYLGKLEQYCKNLSTVIDYFLVVGVETEAFRVNFEHQSLVSSILRQFPPMLRNEILIPESISLFCFPWGVTISKHQEEPSVSYLVLTNEKGNKLYCTSLKIWEPLEEKLEETVSTMESKRSSYSEFFYLPKCLVFVSRLAFFETFALILKKIYSMCSSHMMAPMEFYISHLVLSIPTPPRGQLQVNYRLDDLEFVFKLPPCNKLPLLDVNLSYLFKSLNLENILKVFTCLTLEYSVVFISSDDLILSSCPFTMLSLLFPFYWSLVYVPILPEILLDYLYSPVSYVYGLNSKLKEEIYIRTNESLFIVDLDNDDVQSNAKAVKISNESVSSVSLPCLPVHYTKKLKKRLNKILETAPKNQDFSPETCENIRSAFFQFFVSILSNYKKFMNFSLNADNSGCFNETGFLKDCPDSSKPFFQKFLKTQMFANFCETRSRPQNIEEHSENLLFDEHILAKANRSGLRYSKHPTPFINDESQGITTSWNVVELKHSPISEKQPYGYFPDLSLQTLSEFPLPKTQPPKYSESMDFHHQKSPVIINKCQSDKEFIYTCWVEMWAASLWYQDEAEHNLRVKELFHVLKKLKEITSFSLTPIYKVLLEASARINPSLGMPIFSEMTSTHVMVDAATVHLLQRIISLSFKKDQQNAVKLTGSIFLTDMSGMSNFENSNANVFRRRVFTKAGESHIFAKQELCFLIKETCKKCKKFLSIKEIKEGWQNNEYVFESFCTGCRDIYVPNLRVRVGLEVGHENKTSNRETTIFVSPRALKALVRDLLESPATKFKLDIELYRIYNSMIFWNLIWHFNDNELPFEFILPYEQEVIDVRNSFLIVQEEFQVKTKQDKQVQTDWNLVNIDSAIKKYHEALNKKDA